MRVEVAVLKIDNNMNKMLQLELLSQLFSNSSDDSGSFNVMLESMLKFMDTDSADSSSENSLISSLGLQDLSQAGYGEGQVLNPFVNSIKEDMKSNNINIDQAVDNAAEKYKVDRNLIMAVINQESSFNPSATSKAGAMGLMQLMPGTAQGLGVSNPYDIEQNVEGGTKYLRNLLDMYGNCKELALAAYNAGPNALSRKNVDNPSEINRLPSETQNYVKKVIQYYEK